jgi:hypothetical protein
MKIAINSLLGLGAALGVSVIAAMPAMALTKLTMPSIGGANNSFLWCSNADDPMNVPAGSVKPCSSGVTLDQVLMGGPGAPGGNVELNNTSSAFASNQYTSLTGDLGGKPFFARSLTASDWFSNGNALTKQFLSDALAATGIGLPSGTTFDDLVAGFIASGGPQRFSNPNISYVFKDDTEKLTVGLAGILDASPLLRVAFPGATVPDGVQVSELVYVDFHGQSKYLYSFSAINSGQSDMVGIPGCPGGNPAVNPALAKCSFSGDYNPMLRKAPEPSSLLGLLVIGGGLLATKRGKKS